MPQSERDQPLRPHCPTLIPPPQANHRPRIPKHANNHGEVNPHFHLMKTHAPPFTTLRPKMRQSLPTPQTRRLITFSLALHTRDTSLQPEIGGRLLRYLRTNLRPIASAHPAKLPFNHPARRRRNPDKLRRKENN